MNAKWSNLAEDEALLQQVVKAARKAGLHRRDAEQVRLSPPVNQGHNIHPERGRGVRDRTHCQKRQNPLKSEPENARVKAEVAGARVDRRGRPRQGKRIDV